MDRPTAEEWAERFNARVKAGSDTHYEVQERRGKWRVVARHPERQDRPALRKQVAPIASGVAVALFWVTTIGGCGYVMATTDWSTTGAGSGCDPHYDGACVPADASDVDCEGGSGDGPEYIGQVEVVGGDPYGLDADGDGTGCD